MFHGWMFDPDGDQAAADSTRSSTSLDTGSSVNPRTARRLVTASYTSMIAYLPPAIRYAPTLEHVPPQLNRGILVRRRMGESIGTDSLLGAGRCRGLIPGTCVMERLRKSKAE